MVSECRELSPKQTPAKVLILVLVEDGLRVSNEPFEITDDMRVLILVLVEDGLRVGCQRPSVAGIQNVLILVLVEDGLRAPCMFNFNPYLLWKS